VSLVFDRRGAGPPLVLVHGHGSHWRAWEPILDRLAAEHDVIALDLPGFGTSPPDGTIASIGGFAHRLEAFFAELDLGRPAVSGFSMGGAIALELARRGTVSSSVAFCPAGFWTPGERRWCAGSLRRARHLGGMLPPAVAERMAQSPVARTLFMAQFVARPWRMAPEALVAAVDAQVNAPLFEQGLRHFDSHVFHDAEQLRGVPVTVAWGDRDYLLLSRQAARARRVLPWAQHVTLRGCGHVPFSDDPEACAAAILQGSR
jgi:pimeloyl-ACP methyl ester carboxylesterase